MTIKTTINKYAKAIIPAVIGGAAFVAKVTGWIPPEWLTTEQLLGLVVLAIPVVVALVGNDEESLLG